MDRFVYSRKRTPEEEKQMLAEADVLSFMAVLALIGLVLTAPLWIPASMFVRWRRGL